MTRPGKHLEESQVELRPPQLRSRRSTRLQTRCGREAAAVEVGFSFKRKQRAARGFNGENGGFGLKSSHTGDEAFWTDLLVLALEAE